MTEWKYKLQIKDLINYDNDVLTENQCIELANNMAKRVSEFHSNYLKTVDENDDDEMIFPIEEAIDILENASTVEEINDALEILYDTGDEYSIWIG